MATPNTYSVIQAYGIQKSSISFQKPAFEASPKPRKKSARPNEPREFFEMLKEELKKSQST